MGLGVVDENTSFGDRIKIYRKEKNLTQAELAKESGVSLYAISKAEQVGRRPSFDDMMRLAATLEIPVSHIFYGSKYVNIINSFQAGEITAHMLRGRTLSKVQLWTDIELGDQFFCVMENNCCLLVRYGIYEYGVGFVVADSDTGLLRVSRDKEKGRVIGSVVDDITQRIVPVVLEF